MLILQIVTGVLLIISMCILMSKAFSKQAYAIWGLIFVILLSPMLGELFRWSCAAGVVIGSVIVLRNQVEKLLDFKDPEWSKHLEPERNKRK